MSLEELTGLPDEEVRRVHLDLLPPAGALLLLLGIGASALSVSGLVGAGPTSGWVRTEGTVHSVRVEGLASGEAELQIGYGYSVDGENLEGARVRVHEPRYRYRVAEEADEHASQLRRAGSVTVYYDPDHPSVAVLELEDESDSSLLAVLAVALNGFGGLLLFAGLRRRKGPRRWLIAAVIGSSLALSTVLVLF